MKVVVTGTSGYIGVEMVPALRAAGHEVIGLDNLNAYYDPTLKSARLEILIWEAGASAVELPALGRWLWGAASTFEEMIRGPARGALRSSRETPSSRRRRRATNTSASTTTS